MTRKCRGQEKTWWKICYLAISLVLLLFIMSITKPSAFHSYIRRWWKSTQLSRLLNMKLRMIVTRVKCMPLEEDKHQYTLLSKASMKSGAHALSRGLIKEKSSSKIKLKYNRLSLQITIFHLILRKKCIILNSSIKTLNCINFLMGPPNSLYSIRMKK